MWDTVQMTMTNLTANKERTAAHSQAAEAAMAFVPASALNALKDAQALQDAHDDLAAAHDNLAAQVTSLTQELAAEKEAHATTQAALDAATKTPE